MKYLILAVGVILILGGAWFFTRDTNKTVTTQTTTMPDGTPSKMKVEVTKTDITKNGVSSLPAGFPTDIPVETNNITESYRVAYQGRGVTQYAVSYTSLKTRDSLWDTYSDYLNKTGYAVDKSASKSLGQISGVKGASTLSVIVSNHSGLSLVQINYIER